MLPRQQLHWLLLAPEERNSVTSGDAKSKWGTLPTTVPVTQATQTKLTQRASPYGSGRSSAGDQVCNEVLPYPLKTKDTSLSKCRKTLCQMAVENAYFI